MATIIRAAIEVDWRIYGGWKQYTFHADFICFHLFFTRLVLFYVHLSTNLHSRDCISITIVCTWMACACESMARSKLQAEGIFCSSVRVYESACRYKLKWNLCIFVALLFSFRSVSIATIRLIFFCSIVWLGRTQQLKINNHSLYFRCSHTHTHTHNTH